MITGKPSRTAQRVAERRAAHQLYDQPLVFEDPYALKIIGGDAASALEMSAGGSLANAFRAFMAVRSRHAEDALTAAVARGVQQYVVLGAGLDTFAWRNPWTNPPTILKVFEVDAPATQSWKRQRVAEAGMGEPTSLTYAPVDFLSQTLAEGLRAAGFRADEPAFFSALGVTMYLTPEAFESMAGFVASLPAGGGIVFDYAVAKSELSILSKFALGVLEQRVAAIGEPFTLHFHPQELAATLRRLGFKEVEDAGKDELNALYLHNRNDGLRLKGEIGRIIRATS